MKTSYPTPPTSIIAWVGSAFTSLPSRNVIIGSLQRYNVRSLHRQMKLFRFQHQRKIDAFPFRDVQAAGREKFPVLRLICKKRPGNRRRQNDKTRPRRAHEFCRATLVQWRQEPFHTRAKIPDKTWLLELHGGKLHVRQQRSA